jgi:hypothetical protein
MRTINCHLIYHLGDCIAALHFLINCTRINPVRFNFSCREDYHGQLQEIIEFHTDVITLVPLNAPVMEATFDEDSIDLWISASGVNWFEPSKMLNGFIDQSTYFLFHWIEVAEQMNIICPFRNKYDIIHNQEVLLEPLDFTDKFDYLFINSNPASGQCSEYTVERSDDFIERLQHNSRSVITTRKVGDIPCTTDYNLSIVDIGKLSISNVSNIFAINTGPIHLCMNKWSIPKLDRFFIWASMETFKYGPNFRSEKYLSHFIDNEL